MSETDEKKTRKVRTIEERLAAVAEKKAKLERQEKELIAKKAGATVMGTKAEGSAFNKLLKAEKLFGFTYAQAAAALKVMAKQTPEEDHEKRDRLTAIGEPLLEPFLPEPKTTETKPDEGGEGEPEREAPENASGGNENDETL